MTPLEVFRWFDCGLTPVPVNEINKYGTSTDVILNADDRAFFSEDQSPLRQVKEQHLCIKILNTKRMPTTIFWGFGTGHGGYDVMSVTTNGSTAVDHGLSSKCSFSIRGLVTDFDRNRLTPVSSRFVCGINQLSKANTSSICSGVSVLRRCRHQPQKRSSSSHASSCEHDIEQNTVGHYARDVMQQWGPMIQATSNLPQQV